MADDTPPARDRRVFEAIFDRIRADLAGGRLKPGDKLPAERLLAEQLGVSRSAVREAVRALEASGVVSLQKGVRGGSFINNASADGVSRSINDVIVLGDIPLRQVMEVRSLLLGKAAQLACDQATDAEIEAVAEVIRRLEAPGLRNAQRMDCIREFYILIGRASGNRMLEILIDATSNISLDFATTRRIPFTPELIPMQRAVVSRLRARDGDGAARAIGETLAFLHGFVIARAIDAGSRDGAS
jgi:DNA-binding FadR family transcriptional regulator